MPDKSFPPIISTCFPISSKTDSCTSCTPDFEGMLYGVNLKTVHNEKLDPIIGVE